MTADRFAPIRLAEPGHPPQRCIATVLLEPARAMPCYEGADDQAEWMVNGGREILEGMLVVDCPEVA